MMLSELLTLLKHTPAMLSKQDIAYGFKQKNTPSIQKIEDLYALPADDTAAIEVGNQYLLHACEGMLPSFVEQHPYFAGWSAVMANVSDIAAMGGRALSVVNSYWHTTPQSAELLLEGIQAACTTYGVKLVGGHTNIQANFQPALSVAIQGLAQQLLSVFHVHAGQKILIALNLQGKFHPNTTYWKCFEHVPATLLRAQLELLPEIAEQHLAYAARDISNAGILGSLLMLLEATGSGANICLEQIPKPQHVDWLQWLQIFPSYGFLLTADDDECSDIIELFSSQGIDCTVIGEVNTSGKIDVQLQGQQECFWDFQQECFTGLNYKDLLQQHDFFKVIPEPSSQLGEQQICQV
ncbi:sll0787 family AIR synthase-like protein [Acinetobacter sp.]|uniref:sll0787 family AIR synthase-like protein n=1 Tax=Acinetobacter sp. TaxID=472 RepID=UPI003C793110